MKLNRISKYSFISVLLFTMFLIPASANTVPVNGTVFDSIISNEEMGGGDYIHGTPDYVPESEEDDETAETAPFIKQAIMSIDEEVAAKESEMNYVMYFYNSSLTAMTKSLNFFDGGSILMALINLVTSFFEMIGMCITIIVMLLYNVAANSFLNDIVSSAFDAINDILFQWNDIGSWIYKILFLFGFISILSYLSKNIRKIHSVKQIFPIFIEVFLSGVMVYFVGVYGKTTLNYVEEKAAETLTETFSFGKESSDLPIEIQNKELLFETFQMQPFRIRHFGVATEDAIPEASDMTNKERVQTLLENPNKDNAKKEYNERGNNQISHSVGQTSQVMLLSLIFLIHRFFLAIIMGILSIILLAIGVIKVTLVSISVWQMVYAMIKRDKKSWMWFVNRLQWSLLFILSHVAFNALLFGVNTITGELSKHGSLIVIVFDIVVFIIGKYSLKYLPQFISKLKDCDAMDVAKGIFSGEMSIPQIYNKYSNQRHSEGYDENDEIENDASSSTFADRKSNVSPSASTFDTSLGDNDDISFNEDDNSDYITDEGISDVEDKEHMEENEKTNFEKELSNDSTKKKAEDSYEITKSIDINSEDISDNENSEYSEQGESMVESPSQLEDNDSAISSVDVDLGDLHEDPKISDTSKMHEEVFENTSNDNLNGVDDITADKVFCDQLSANEIKSNEAADGSEYAEEDFYDDLSDPYEENI